jgi:hypothetical protein
VTKKGCVSGGIGFPVHTNLITYLSNVEGFEYGLQAPQTGSCLRC